MSEYWVSQSKYYCKYCNAWMADNKPSRSHHDNGIKHKMAFEKFQKDKRDKNLHGARSERDLKDQMQEIENAARDAMTQDQHSLRGQFYSSSSNGMQTGKPPPPPRAYEDINRVGKTSNDENGTGNVAASSKEESSGTYVIRGQTYLEGTAHTDELRQGTYCELFIEHSEEWVSARVIQRQETAVPHTNLVLKSFSIRYSRLEAFTDQPTYAVEEGVKSDRLRLLAYPDGTVMSDGPDPAGIIRQEGEGSAVEGESSSSSSSGSATNAIGQAWAKKASVAAPKSLLDMDPATGFSGWSTVSVEVIDEAAQAREQQERLQEETELRSKETQAKLRNIELERLSAASSDNVLANVDPYGTGVYKGLFVGDMEQLREAELPSLAHGAVVGFKKRRRPGQEASNVTNININTNTNSSTSNVSVSSYAPMATAPTTSTAHVAAHVTVSTVESKEGMDDNEDYIVPTQHQSKPIITSSSTAVPSTSTAPVKVSMSFKSGVSQKPTRQKFNDDAFIKGDNDDE